MYIELVRRTVIIHRILSSQASLLSSTAAISKYNGCKPGVRGGYRWYIQVGSSNAVLELRSCGHFRFLEEKNMALGRRVIGMGGLIPDQRCRVATSRDVKRAVGKCGLQRKGRTLFLSEDQWPFHLVAVVYGSGLDPLLISSSWELTGDCSHCSRGLLSGVGSRIQVQCLSKASHLASLSSRS